MRQVEGTRPGGAWAEGVWVEGAWAEGARAEEARAEEARAEEAEAKVGATIFIVDDEEANVRLLERILKRHGYGER